ncbi:MAG: hypothetical protein K2G01_07525, partial [Paramuribaculum sp.]|nr:hypothetical protein [Paramuribaculum sp.]
VRKPPLTEAPVFASALLTTIPATFGTGNSGRLGVNIIANRLLAAGAQPRYISATVTIDLDTPQEIINEVAMGMRDGAIQAEMEWATAETAILPTGPANGISLSFFGVGCRMVNVTSPLDCARPGDVLIVTGNIGATGAAVAGMRQGIEVLTESDGTALTDVMRSVYVHQPDIPAVCFPIHGINAALESLGVKAEIDRKRIPCCDAVRSACDIMGLDPLEMATSDAMLLAVSEPDAGTLLESVRRYRGGESASIIGHITD